MSLHSMLEEHERERRERKRQKVKERHRRKKEKKRREAELRRISSEQMALRLAEYPSQPGTIPPWSAMSQLHSSSGPQDPLLHSTAPSWSTVSHFHPTMEPLGSVFGPKTQVSGNNPQSSKADLHQIQGQVIYTCTADFTD
jgi:hypothetical protein